MTTDNDKALRNYRRLLYFYNKEIAVHIVIESGQDAGLFRNGSILDLNLSKLTLVIKDFVLGEKPYLLEELEEESICAYTIREGGK